jgi:sulfur relay (sulfurtransferase) DsrF/TusC family protein
VAGQVAGKEALRAVFAGAGLSDAEISTHTGTARFPSLASWMYADIEWWTLAYIIDNMQFQQLLHEAEQVLRPFVAADGSVAFDTPAQIVTAG